MNSQKNIWSDFPLSMGIATFVCYAGIFNDVIDIEELAAKLGLSGQAEFYAAVNELHLQGRLISKDGFVGLPGLEDKIAIKAAKVAMARQLISIRLDYLKKLGRSPIVKFVGISGSLAANNPTRDRNNHLDLDVFLITRNQCLWLYNILRGLKYIFPRSKQEPELCIGYVMDESTLLVPNRNFYTATEIRNLIPIAGFDVYRKFLQINSWVNYYYPGISDPAAPSLTEAPANNLINKVFYVIYNLFRSIKWLSLDIVRNISFKLDPYNGISLHQLKTPYGGYQALVLKKLSRLAETWFPELLDAGLIEKLFPDELSTEITRGHIDVPKILAQVASGYDYSKYG